MQDGNSLVNNFPNIIYNHNYCVCKLIMYMNAYIHQMDNARVEIGIQISFGTHT